VKKIAAALAAVAVSVVSGQAAAQVYFKGPVDFAGTGCGAGSYTLTGVGTDTLSIMFSAYDAADPPEHSRSQLTRAACNVAIPVHVPEGCQISVITADWRGYSQGTTELVREYFFAGEQNMKKAYRPALPYEDYTTTDRLQYKTVRAAEDDVIFRINSSVHTLAAESYIIVDTVDLKNTLVLHLNQESCSQQGLPALPPILKLLL
jgi:hypothetical protein